MIIGIFGYPIKGIESKTTITRLGWSSHSLYPIKGIERLMSLFVVVVKVFVSHKGNWKPKKVQVVIKKWNCIP